MIKRSSARYILFLYIGDLVLTVCALLAARWLRIHVTLGRPLQLEGATLQWPVFVLAVIVWSATLTTFRVYQTERFTHLVDELQNIAAAIVTAALIYAGILYLSYRGLSRLLFIYFLLLDIALCVIMRVLGRSALTHHNNQENRRVLIIGVGATASNVAESLAHFEWTGLELVGYLAPDDTRTGERLGSCPIIGTYTQALQLVAEHAVQEVVMALSSKEQGQLESLVRQLEGQNVNIKVASDYSELVFLRASYERLGNQVLIGLKEPVINPIDRLIKRVVDICVALAGLSVLAPLLGIVAALVKATSPGPVLYASERVGEDGVRFKMLKFRTMRQDADQSERELITETADGKLLFNKQHDDPRITPVGRVLRRLSLDELPQLLNVLKGEMSLVGPRPELPSIVARYDSWQEKRLTVPQGMTGWWQISGRGNKAKYLHVEDDLYYIRNYSLLLDLQIIWRTLGAVLKGEGAF